MRYGRALMRPTVLPRWFDPHAEAWERVVSSPAASLVSACTRFA